MSFLDKIAFWKKEDEDFNFDKIANQSSTDLTNPMNSSLGAYDPFNTNPSLQTPPTTPNLPRTQNTFQQAEDKFSSSSADQLGIPTQELTNPAPTYAQNPQQSNTDTINKKEIELINSKLDTIKVLLESIDNRVAKIEQISQQHSQSQQGSGHSLW